MHIRGGVASGQLYFASAILHNPDGAPPNASQRTQPFAPARARADWGRVAKFVRFVLAALIDVWPIV